MKNTIFKSITTAVLFFAASFGVFAQTVQVKGTVKDSKGEPVIGAAVCLVSDRTKGSVTDVNGAYVIAIPASAYANAELEASCLSYKTVIEKVNRRSVLDFVLQDDSQQLDEVVVVGYGAMRRSDLTGSVTSLKIDETEAGRSASIDQLLQGAAAGVNVINDSSAPGAGVSIRIRGTSSLNGSSEPLYVVDGVIMSDAASGSVSGDMAEDSNGLMGINPSDIASIEILKDASATAIYGADGANGVVLITTKQSNRERPQIRFNAGFDYSTRMRKIDMLDFNEYVDLLYDRDDSNARSFLKKIYEDPDTRSGLKVTPVDWQDYAMQNVLNQRYFFSVAGSPKSLRYSLSLGANLQDGIVKCTGVDQYTVRLNVDKTFSKKFIVGTKTNFAYIYAESQQGANSDAVQSSASLMKSLLSYRPFITSATIEEEELMEDEDTENYSGPDKWFKYAKATRKEFRITPSLYAKYQIVPWLSFKSQIGGDYRSSERTQWRGRKVTRTTAIGGESNDVRYRWSWDNTFDFKFKLDKHSISGTAGMTLGQDGSMSYNNSGNNILQENLMIDNLASAYRATTKFTRSGNSRTSFFVRGIYNFNERYVVTATFRLDGSSRFRAGNRFSGFPSVAAAWRLNQEPWFNVPCISTAKLRLGWGMVGNSSVSSYQTFNLYGTSLIGYPLDDAGYATGIHQSNFSNEDLKWETTKQWNGGLDLAFFRGRLSLSVDAYDKLTTDLLQSRNVPLASGFSTRWVNQGNIRNRGIEASLDALVLKRRNFEWSIAGNISLNRNCLESLGFAVDPKEIYLEEGVRSEMRYYLGSNLAGSVYLKNPGNIFVEGMPIGLYYGYKTDGIVQEGETGTPVEGRTDSSGALIPQKPGQIRYVDMDGDGVITINDRTVIGDMNAKFSYGFKTTFSLFRFTLTANFNGVYGNKLLNANLAQLTDPTWTSCTNMLSEAYHNAWTPYNQSNTYFSIKDGWTNSTEKGFVTDRYIEDASYLRLSLLSLSYDFKMPKKTKVFKGISLGASCSNVFMITKYSGWSPIVNSFGKSMTKMGIDLGSYPMARSYSFDIKLRF